MNLSIRLALCTLLPSLWVGLLDSVASAQEQAFDPPRAKVTPLRVKLHVVLPLAQLNLVNPGGGIGSSSAVTFAGASLEAEFLRLWALEMGAAGVVGIGADFPTNSDAFVRGGLVPVVYDARNQEGLGWTIQFDALAGYRWLKRNQSPDGHPGTETTHAIRGNLGLDFTREYSGIAFVARVLSGVTLPLAQTRTGYWESHSYINAGEDLKWALDLGIDIGVAL
jgi:hypothetical protein